MGKRIVQLDLKRPSGESSRPGLLPGGGDDEESSDTRHGVRWFGRFGEKALATNPSELSSGIGDFLRDHGDARDRVLQITPMRRQMFSVILEPSPSDGTALAARIPVGPKGRRKSLTSIGWAIERVNSGSPYYTKRFSGRAALAPEVADLIVEAYRLLYGDRATGIGWELSRLSLWGGIGLGAAHPLGAPSYDPTLVGLRDRMMARFRDHPVMSLLMAALGLWTSNLIVGESAHGLILSPPVAVAILVVGTVSGLLAYLSGAPSGAGEASADFWGTGGSGSLIVTAAFVVLAALGGACWCSSCRGRQILGRSPIRAGDSNSPSVEPAQHRMAGSPAKSPSSLKRKLGNIDSLSLPTSWPWM